METSDGDFDPYRSSGASGSVGNGSSSRRYTMQLSTSSFIQAPLAALLEYSGVLRPRSSSRWDSENFTAGEAGAEHASGRRELSSSSSGGGHGEVLIRIIAAGDHDGVRAVGQGPVPPSARVRNTGENSAPVEGIPTASDSDGLGEHGGNDYRTGELSGSPASQLPSVPPAPQSLDGDANLGGATGSESSYQRFDIQQLAKWVEQILPFSLLLLVVFIRQHLQEFGVAGNLATPSMVVVWKPRRRTFPPLVRLSQPRRTGWTIPMDWSNTIPSSYEIGHGFFVTIWIAAVMFKSNDILRKQTALKGERKMPVLVGIIVVFMLHVFGVYWWYRNDDLLNPLVLLPPKEIPPFWHAIFIILVNDTMVRQAAMVLKCVLLIYYRTSRGRGYRKQGQMLTLVEYFLLLYRALLPTPVWYRFFLNKEYGSLFSSLITGLYLTIKLTSVVDKIQSFIAAMKALSCKDVHYGSHATPEQVIAAGDLCAICQEKMHAPILLRCKHIFCEDCVSEWFDRERTCPLCRALVKPAGLRSFGDGSTSLFFQLF